MLTKSQYRTTIHYVRILCWAILAAALLTAIIFH